MAESIVQVTEGAGKKLHTWSRVVGANTVEDEIVLLGENYPATYNVVSAATSLATGASHIFQIMAGAALKVRIRRIEVYQTVVATAAAIAELTLFRLSTAGTGGSVLTPQPYDSTDAAAGATCMTLPTAKGTETTALGRANAYLIQTLGASTPFASPAWVWDFDRPRSKPIIIPAGVANGLAIKNNLAAYAGASVETVVIFDELAF